MSVTIPIDPARLVTIKDERWDADNAAVARAEKEGRTISDDEAADLHRRVLEALDDIIIWCALTGDLEAHRTAVFDLREKFGDLIYDNRGG